MDLSIFGHHDNEHKARVDVPPGYDAHVRWIPRLGDIFPNFDIAHEGGTFCFHDWAEGNWVYFFSHPAAFTPVCTTEIADVAAHGEELARRGVKALNLSLDTPEMQAQWIGDIERLFGVKVNFPLLSDPTAKIAGTCGMLHPHEDKVLCVRKSFVIDPSLRIRLITEYPLNVGRDFEEVLRVIDALQATNGNGLVAPGGWMPGDPLLVHPYIYTDEAKERFGTRLRVLNRYMRLLPPKLGSA